MGRLVFSVSVASLLLGEVYAAPPSAPNTVVVYDASGKPRAVDATTHILPGYQRYIDNSAPATTTDATPSNPGGAMARVLAKPENIEAQVAFAKGSTLKNSNPAEALSNYRRAAALGHARANLEIGEWYFEQRPQWEQITQKEALACLQKAGRANDAYALVLLGDLYSQQRENSPLARDNEMAATFYQQCADYGIGCPSHIAEANRKLGIMYVIGTGVPRDWTEAEERLTKGWGYLELGNLYVRQARSAKTPQEANALVEKALKAYGERASNADALAALGDLYASGLGVTADLDRAQQYWGQAAALGSLAAKISLKKIDPADLAKDPDPSLLADIKAGAEKGSPAAQYLQGVVCRDGVGAPADDAAAARWFKLAAAQGNADASVALAECYAKGRGVKRNLANAFARYEEAATAGNAAAALALAREYASNGYLGRNSAKAEAFYAQAAKAGIAEAQYGYAQFLARGDNRRSKEVVALLEQAADQGYAPAQRDYVKIFFASRDIPLSARMKSPAYVEEDAFNAAKVFAYAREISGKGEPAADFYLARCFNEGVGTGKSDAEATRILTSISPTQSSN